MIKATQRYGIMAVFLIAAAAFAAVSAFGAGGGAAIERQATLKSSAETRSQEVCLGDLVEDAWLKGRCAVDHKACCRWSMEGALSREFKRVELQREIDRFDLGGIAVKITGADAVAVTQTKRELRAAEIQARILDALTAKIKNSNGSVDGSIAVTSLKVPVPIYVPLNNENNWTVAIPETLAERISAKILSASDPTATLGWANATLSRKIPIYVSKVTVRPSDKIRIEDFELKSAEIFAGVSAGANTEAATYFMKDRFPEGVRARVTVRAGTALAAGMVERSPIVQLGDVVTLVLRSDSMKISTKGVAQGPAAVGDMVTVQLQRYSRAFRGKLLEGRQVEVWF